MDVCDKSMGDIWKFITWEHYTTQRQLFIVKFTITGESLVTTIRKERLIFNRSNAPNRSTVKKMIERFECFDSVVDVNHTTRTLSGVEKQTSG